MQDILGKKLMGYGIFFKQMKRERAGKYFLFAIGNKEIRNIQARNEQDVVCTDLTILPLPICPRVVDFFTGQKDRGLWKRGVALPMEKNACMMSCIRSRLMAKKTHDRKNSVAGAEQTRIYFQRVRYRLSLGLGLLLRRGYGGTEECTRRTRGPK